jgi:hypothetical protein
MAGAAKQRARSRAESEIPPEDLERPPPLDTVPEQGEGANSESHDSPGPGDSEETMETPGARYARLKALLLEKRQREEIEEMEKELSGDDPTYRAEVAGVTPAQGHKRAISSTAEMQPVRSSFNRPKTPLTFTGKDIAELDKFNIAFRAHFEARGPYSAFEQIRLAATFLDGNPQKSWFRRPKPESSAMT